MLKNKAFLSPSQEGDEDFLDKFINCGYNFLIEETHQDFIKQSGFISPRDLLDEKLYRYSNSNIETHIRSQISSEEASEEITKQFSLGIKKTLNDRIAQEAKCFAKEVQGQEVIDPASYHEKIDEEIIPNESNTPPQHPQLPTIKEESSLEEKSDLETDKVRYRLVKKRSERRRDDLNTSHIIGFGKSKISNPRLHSKVSLTFNLQNRRCNQSKNFDYLASEGQVCLNETVNFENEEKENDDEKDEQDETREGSQKELENNFDKSQLEDLNTVDEKVVLLGGQDSKRLKEAISERWSNSDSKDLENEEIFDDKTSRASFSMGNEKHNVTSNNQTSHGNASVEKHGFVRITDYKDIAKEINKSPNNPEKRRENDSKISAKIRDFNHFIIYETKNKNESKKEPIKESPTINKIAISSLMKSLEPKFSGLSNVPESDNVQNVETNPLSQVVINKPKKLKPLSINSPSLDFETIKISKVKELAREFFEKKIEKDIYDHVSYITEESNRMMKFRIMAHNRIEYCLKKLFTGLKIQTNVFGSCATGLALPTSDVDICVCGLKINSRSDIIQYLITINNKLKNFKWVINNKPILTANVPVLKLLTIKKEIDTKIKFCEVLRPLKDDFIINAILEEAPKDLDNLEDQEENFRIKVDLSLESFMPLAFTAHLGYQSTGFVHKMLNQYESLYTIAIILKEFLNNRGYLDNSQGGLSSYCLVILIVAIFRKFKDEGSTKSLKRLLSFYGEIFQPHKTGISIGGTDPFFPLNYYCDPAPLWILDNINCIGRNIGQGAFAIKEILQEFEKASNFFKSLQEKIQNIAIRNKDEISCIEDFEKLKDIELITLANSNSIESLVKRT